VCAWNFNKESQGCVLCLLNPWSRSA
jgi:hypothetical protein